MRRPWLDAHQPLSQEAQDFVGSEGGGEGAGERFFGMTERPVPLMAKFSSMAPGRSIASP